MVKNSFSSAKRLNNKPEQLSKALDIYEFISKDTNASIADLIVLGGNLGIEKACGFEVPLLLKEMLKNKQIQNLSSTLSQCQMLLEIIIDLDVR